METDSSDTDLDPLITALLPIVDQAVQNVTQRQFIRDDGPTTHTFRVSSWHVDLAPFDLRSATLVKFDPNDGNQTLAVHTDYELQPANSPNGVYTSIQLSQWLSLSTTKMMNFGFADLAVTGSWGFAAVPTPVQQAAIIAIRSWLRRDVATYAQVDPAQRTMTPEPYGTYKLPPASLSMLDPYMRFPAGAAVA
jgi:hypothetical protein